MTDGAPTGGARPAGEANRWLAEGDGVPRGPDYDARVAARAAAGEYLHAEADLVMSLSPSRVLDAGCGTGRVAVELARRGVDVVGVDLDPSMLAEARRKAPGLTWLQEDLALLDLEPAFDVVLAAGNVMIFLTPGSERHVTARLAAHLRPGGHLVCGFALGGGHLPLADHLAHAEAAGLTPVARQATWEGAPYDGGDYVVTVHRRPTT